MYLSHLKLWNFRKYGSGNHELDLDNPDLTVPFTEGLNVLVGENDSGKTAIIDAVKLVLKTHSWEYIRPDAKDFHKESTRFRIECRFEGLRDDEAKNFIEWLGMTGQGAHAKPHLRVFLDVVRTCDRILPYEVKAGADDEGHQLTAEARDYLKVVFLRPLRDAEGELIARRSSRFSQILEGHDAFKGPAHEHYLVKMFDKLNENIRLYFKGKRKNEKEDEEDIPDIKGRELKEEIDRYLESFCDLKSIIEVSGGDQKRILEALSLTLEDKNAGLGTYNRLFIAAELLHLNKKNWNGLRLGLIEELEAHLHPQAQLRVIESLQEQKGVQLILTTHSPNLGSKVKLKNLIIGVNHEVYPMGVNYTRLGETDYYFLERFLDVTKANLFFAKGVILVEGWAEEIILPILAKIIGCDFSKNGVTVVNVAGKAFLRYSKIFQRKTDPEMGIPISVITDLDLKPQEQNAMSEDKYKAYVESKRIKYENQNVRAFISPHWTLEYCIASCPKLQKSFYFAVLKALKEIKEDKGVGDLDKYVKSIEGIDSHFNNWKADDIPFLIYEQILGVGEFPGLCTQKISKAIIAQHFAKQLMEMDEAGNFEAIIAEQEEILYLMEAIKYASGAISNNR